MFNPIEELFAIWKNYLRKFSIENVDSLVKKIIDFKKEATRIKITGFVLHSF